MSDGAHAATGVFEQFRLDGRVAVITGASEGIGRAVAIGLAEAGADIVACCRDATRLAPLVEEVTAIGRRAEGYSIDITDNDQIRRFRDHLKAEYGTFQILFNGAAYTANAVAWETTEEEWDLSVDTSFKGLFFASTILGELMRDAGYGKVINMSSTFARTTAPARSVYSAIKAGVTHLTEALAVEWGEAGIRVNCLAPTAVWTPSREAYLTKFGDRITARIPLGRFAQTDDLIGASIYLASPASDFVTGHTMYVDGGFVAHG